MSMEYTCTMGSDSWNLEPLIRVYMVGLERIPDYLDNYPQTEHLDLSGYLFNVCACAKTKHMKSK